MSGFKPAERKVVKLKLAITGPSGSGKTYSALQIAKGMGGNIALIDTENGSASLYADNAGMPKYCTMELAPPFSTARYIAAIQDALKAKFDVLIIDSLSHQWAGEGGIMDRLDKEKVANPKGNTFSMWAKYSPEHEKFKQALLQSDIHIIATMRSKQQYEIAKDDRGRNVPQKMGMAPVQRDQMDYEFTTVFDMDEDHFARVSKDRTNLFGKEVFHPTEETGSRILTWLQSGKEVSPPNTTSPPPGSSAQLLHPGDIQHLRELREKAAMTKDQMSKYIFDNFGGRTILQINFEEYKLICIAVEKLIEAKANVVPVQPPLQPPEQGDFGSDY